MNTITNNKRAHVLVQALPYIKNYAGETVVVKYSGNAMIGDALKEEVIKDIVLMHQVGIKVVLVHGGGPEIDSMLAKVGIDVKMEGGTRCLDKDGIGVVQQVLAGKINKDLVQLIESHQGKAMGLCGLDGSMLTATMIDSESLGFVGQVEEVNTEVIEMAQKGGYIPVISAIASGYDTTEVLHVNSDTVASKIASALGASNLILMTDVKGILENKEDESSLIPEIKVSEVPKYKKNGVISGEMVQKVDCCVEAVRRGVSKATIIDGTEEHSILVELFTDEGIGTLFC